MGLSSLPAAIAGPQRDALSGPHLLEDCVALQKQLLLHRDLWYPFPPIKARKEVLHLDHLQSQAEWLKPCRVLAHALGHKLEAVPQEELPWSADTPPAETSPDGGPRL